MSRPPIDKKNLRILHILDKDCRTTAARIAQQVGLSKQNVHYRIRRMEQTGIILGYTTVINSHALGQQAFRIYLRYRDTRRETEAIRHLTDDPHVVWFASMIGSWDIEAVFLARNSAHCSSMVKRLRATLPGVFSEHIISPSLVNYHLSRDYLLERKRDELHMPHYGKEPEPMQADEIDLRLLRELSRDSRRSNRELAKATGVTHQTIRRRMESLERCGVVQQHKARLNLAALGRTYYKALVYLDNPDQAQEAALLAFCSRYHFVVYLIEAIGEWHFEIEAEVKSEQEFASMLRDLRGQFPGLVRKLELLHLTKEHKLDYLPNADELIEELHAREARVATILSERR